MLDILWCVTKFLPLLYKIVMVIFNHSIIKLLWSFFVRLADDHHMPPSTSIRLSFASPCRLPDFPLRLNPSSLTDMPPPTLLACDSGHAPTAPPHGLPSLGLTIIPRPPLCPTTITTGDRRHGDVSIIASHYLLKVHLRP
jgi:hypothetical protein